MYLVLSWLIRLGHRWKDNIKADLEMGCDSVEWIYLVWGRV
jgi:hypothetical protein